jgi:hypothetical protein
MVLNAYNYCDGCFCPLAVGVGLDRMVDPTHDKVFAELTAMGYKVYNTRGILGEFYTTNRRDDLILAAKEVLEEYENQRLDGRVVEAQPGCRSASGGGTGYVSPEFVVSCVDSVAFHEELENMDVDDPLYDNPWPDLPACDGSCKTTAVVLHF